MNTSNLHHLQLTAPDGTGRAANVLLNGDQILNLTGITVTIDADSFVHAELRLLVPPVTFDGKAKVTVPDETAGTLIALGWTPPAEDEELDCLDCEDDCCDNDEPDAGPYGLITIDENGKQRAASATEATIWADSVVADGILPADHPSVVRVRETYAAQVKDLVDEWAKAE